MPLHIATPLLESLTLSRLSGSKVWLKMEALQPPGSFKIRGIGCACEEYVRRGARRFISSSGGNAGLAVAYAGRRLGVPVTVVLPKTTGEGTRELIRREGAEVQVLGDSWQEANEAALAMVGKSDAFLHPFDDPLLWEGHASLVDEVAREGLKPDAVVLSVGGGGLYSGVVEGLRRQGWGDVPVVAVETLGAESFHRALEAGRLVRLERVTSIATSLATKQVCERAFQLAREHPTRSVLVPDRAAVAACRRFIDDHRVLVEPACGAALAPVYDGFPELREFATLLVVVCGGVNVSLRRLRQWELEYGLGQGDNP